MKLEALTPKIAFVTAGIALFLVWGRPAYATPISEAPPIGPINQGPPSGALLNLNGTPEYKALHQYSVSFIASLGRTTISFAFRDDPSYLYFSDPMVIDTATSNGNLLANASFQGGIHTSGGNQAAPVNWTYANPDSASVGGFVGAYGYPHCAGHVGIPGSSCWVDGAVQAYDFLRQTINTKIGDTYSLTFYLGELSGLSSYASLTTNNNAYAVDVLAYASGGVRLRVASVPEPPSSGMFVIGLALILTLALLRRKTLS